MPQLPIIMPQLGESIAEATVIGFLAQAGDTVEADQDIVEVETNKATMNVSSPARGKVTEWTAKRDESYAVGEVLGYLEVTKEEAERLGLDAPPQRLNAKDTPVPYHPNLWAAHRPTARSIVEAARNLLRT